MLSIKRGAALAVGLVGLVVGLGRATGDEIGADDFKISDAGDPGDPSFVASNPAVAYNPDANEYLVVWSGSDNQGAIDPQEREIFGQRINADTGEKIAPNEFRISDMGTDGVPDNDAFNPSVVYNPDRKEYLVVWEGDDTNNEFEVFGQRLSETGAEVGTNDFRVSDMGPDGNTTFLARAPDVAYNTNNKEYLVVWEGRDDTVAEVVNEREIYGQRLDGLGAEVGNNDFLISDAESGTNQNANNPSVSYNPDRNEYLVAFPSGAIFSGQVNEETEVFAQRLDAAGGKLLTGAARVSDMGPDGDSSFDASRASVAYNRDRKEFLVVWEGTDNQGSLVDTEFEIFGQRLDDLGGEVGTNDFRISDMGPDGNGEFDAEQPDVAYNPINKEYLVTWDADDDQNGFVDNDFTIFMQRLSDQGAEVGVNDFLVSRLGPDGDINFSAFSPAVAVNATSNSYLIAFDGADSDGGEEVFGQLLSDTKCGNGIVESGASEACDDGNNVNGDGCDSSCLVEADGGNGNGGGCSLIR